MIASRVRIYAAVALVFIAGACGHKSSSEPTEESTEESVVENVSTENKPVAAESQYNGRIKVNNIGRLSEIFNDSNRYQYACAEKLGIEPITDLSKAWNTRRPIVYIEGNEHYLVDTLEHSLPFLVPEAAALLDTIGKNFIDSLHRRGGDGYTIKVTSLLRTPSTVKRLRRVNVNASDSSTHQFGTTFDLSYIKFNCLNPDRPLHDGDLKNLLAEVLNDLKKKNLCMVKFERKTGCFHITVTEKFASSYKSSSHKK